MLRGLDGYLLILVVGQHCGFQAPAWTRRRLASLSAARGLRRRSLTLFGGHSEGETPLPIPNRAVKPLRADGTWPSRAWESRSPPNYFSNGPPRSGGPFAFQAAVYAVLTSALTILPMSVLAIVLIVLAALIVLFLIGGYVGAKRRANRPGWEDHIRATDHALEQARAEDRGWDRELIEAAARASLSEQRPGFEPASLALVLVDDRPGVEEDRAHMVAAGPDASVRLVLARDASGAWGVERVD